MCVSCFVQALLSLVCWIYHGQVPRGRYIQLSVASTNLAISEWFSLLAFVAHVQPALCAGAFGGGG
jgi:hypothetical protein